MLWVSELMELAEEARPAPEQWSVPPVSLLVPFGSYSSPAADHDTRGMGLVGGRRRSAMASLLIRPCVLRCKGVLGDIFWV
jgi:hypothetical protein